MRARALIAIVSCALMAAAAAPAGARLPDLPLGEGPVAGTGAVGVRAADAVTLSKPTPRWYTRRLHRRAVAAGPAGVPVPAGVRLPDNALSVSGIRPGSWMISPAWCTLNFVFGSDSGPLYIGTAGHCTKVGDEVTMVEAPGVLVKIGTTVKSRDNGVGDDFALIRIDKAMRDRVNPSMAVVGGPTGAREPAVGDAVFHVGHGALIGTGGTPRAGLVTYSGPGERKGRAFVWTGVAAPGDSGSGVRSIGGDAVGNLTHLLVDSSLLPGTVAGTTMKRIERIARVPLLTAAAVPDPL